MTGKKAYLILENGKIFEGEAFGAQKEIVAEVVFTTNMNGYLETLTDHSYYGQAVVQTFPLIGNYGVIPEDFESGTPVVSAYIVKHCCTQPSNFRNQGTLDDYLRRQGIPGICEIDTRELTRIIRTHGTMNGLLTYSLQNVNFERIKRYRIREAVESVSVKAPVSRLVPNARYRVALFDFGFKENIRRELEKRGCEVTVLPYDTTAETLRTLSPDGIMLSNGPGDPADNPKVIANLKEVLAMGIPTFGICLGHQLTALASGFATHKLKFGHRGANQPVRDQENGRVYITSQNHGYAVVSSTIDPNRARELFVNVNDGTCEGIVYLDKPVFTVQFHPEACAGPQDTGFLFDRFIAMMGGCSHAAQSGN